LGVLELFEDKKVITLIEWAERIEEILPKNTIRVKITETNSNSRQVEIVL
jgi:tRNA A37 threonylcarbamoyladenosine biosynthesis protein TsaE